MSEKQFLIIGTGRFGSALAVTLTDLGHEVVAVDRDEGVLDEISDKVTHAAIVDATDEDALRKLGIHSFDTVIVAIGTNLEASVLATVAAKAAGARRLVSKADGKISARVLASVGADEVVQPEHDMGVRLARQLSSANIVDAFELGSDHRVVEMDATPRLEGTLAELSLPRRFRIQVVAVHRDDEIVVGPGAEYAIERTDRLVLIGADTDFDRFYEHAVGEDT